MPLCSQCGSHLRLIDNLCPTCSERFAEGRVDSDDRHVADRETAAGAENRVAIARMTNGAEAGYFADELLRTMGVEVEVVGRERFDGVHAVWSVDYVLMAPELEALRLAQALQELVEGADVPEEAGDLSDPARNEGSYGVWGPLLLTLAAGSIACWGVDRADQRARPRPAGLVDRDPRQSAEFWRQLERGSGEWMQTSADGRSTRTLTFDVQRGTAVLREDNDGDGTFEHEWAFRRNDGGVERRGR